jgi:hypothetical protein
MWMVIGRLRTIQGRCCGEWTVVRDVLRDASGGAVCVGVGLQRNETMMGSGTNRAWWREFGSRSGRKSATKAGGRTKVKKAGYLKMKALRAEAARRSNP